MLIAMAGLPGSGKSTIAEAIASRRGYCVVSVDPIESAMLVAGIEKDQPTGLAAYLVAETIADSSMMIRESVIVDAVNAVDPAREQWVHLAKRHGAEVRFIEVTCSDATLHRTRLESRTRGLAHLPEPTWNLVLELAAEYGPWSGISAQVPRITLDSVLPLESVVHTALSFLDS
jgi:predicted kinase